MIGLNWKHFNQKQTLKRPFCPILGSAQDSHNLGSDFAKMCWIVNCKFPPTNLSQNRMVMNLGGYFWKSLWAVESVDEQIQSDMLLIPMQWLKSHVKSLSINVLIYWFIVWPWQTDKPDNEKLDLMTRADKLMWRSNVQYWAPPPAWIIQPVFLRGENTKTIWLPSKKYESSSFLQHHWQQWRQKRKDCCCASSFSLYNVFPAFLWPATTPPDLKLSDKGGKKVGSPP